LRWPQPQRDVRRLHRLSHNAEQIGTQPVEIRLIPNPPEDSCISRRTAKGGRDFG
jgi:hypothetical protein